MLHKLVGIHSIESIAVCSMPWISTSISSRRDGLQAQFDDPNEEFNGIRGSLKLTSSIKMKSGPKMSLLSINNTDDGKFHHLLSSQRNFVLNY